MLVAYLGTCEVHAIGLAEYLPVDLVDSKEYLIGVSVGTEEFALGRLKCVAIVVDRSIIGGDEGLWSLYQVDPLRVLVMINLRVQVLERVIYWVLISN